MAIVFSRGRTKDGEKTTSVPRMVSKECGFISCDESVVVLDDSADAWISVFK